MLTKNFFIGVTVGGAILAFVHCGDSDNPGGGAAGSGGGNVMTGSTTSAGPTTGTTTGSGTPTTGTAVTTGSSGGGSTGGASSTGSTGGSGGATGGSGGGAGSGGGSGRCGGIAGLKCKATEFCDYEPNSCGQGDMLGTCKSKPQGCLADCPGICGCDGKFYCNACTAQTMGVDQSSDTSCTKTDGGAGDGGPRGDGGLNTMCMNDSECQADLKCCYPCGRAGCQNACIVPLSNGRCPMFP
jgi:hypothetical protein